MYWHFQRQPAGQVEQEITQRDQFSNDDVDLSETIIRESIQNSLDAAVHPETTVRVTYRFLGSENELSADFLKSLVADQLPHARAAELELSDFDPGEPSALVIEDFGTTGLTGSTDEIDDHHFSDFWRRHGKSHKHGKSRGRWGLGKLVYSATSEIGVFFGLTARESDSRKLHLMGQTVLNLRTHHGHRYPPHGFFAKMTSDDPIEGLPVPVPDSDLVDRFVGEFCLDRKDKSGLSVIIPFPNRNFRVERMIGVAVSNYFYPLITGQLNLAFNDVEVNTENVRYLAEKYAKEEFHDIDPLFDFVERAHGFSEEELLVLRETWADDKKLDENDFEETDLDRIRSQFVNGDIIGVKLPISLTRKNGEKVSTSFRVFIQRPENLSRGLDIYVRQGLIVSGEKKFDSRKALGILIAEDAEICDFLGDAENAAHTKWVGSAEKLKKNYRAPQDKVRLIRFALRNLYDMLAQDVEEVDARGLAKFFSVPSEKPKGKTPRTTPVNPVPPLEPRVQRIAISKVAGGFRIRGPENPDSSLYPCVVKVRAAYGVIRGNAFAKYSDLDFRFDGRGMTVTATGDCSLAKKYDNRLELLVTSSDFELTVDGFDGTRDVKIDARALEADDAEDL